MSMTAEHKAALAQGRKEARAIKSYLDALNSRRPGRPATKESLQARLEAVTDNLDDEPNTLKQVELFQRKLDIEEQLSDLDGAVDIDELEKAFVNNAKSYSERKDITYTAWRDFGVPAATLKRAGIPETRRRS